MAGLLPTDLKHRKAEQKSEPVFSKSFGFRTLFWECSESLFWHQSSTSRRCKTSSPMIILLLWYTAASKSQKAGPLCQQTPLLSEKGPCDKPINCLMTFCLSYSNPHSSIWPIVEVQVIYVYIILLLIFSQGAKSWEHCCTLNKIKAQKEKHLEQWHAKMTFFLSKIWLLHTALQMKYCKFINVCEGFIWRISQQSLNSKTKKKYPANIIHVPK